MSNQYHPPLPHSSGSATRSPGGVEAVNGIAVGIHIAIPTRRILWICRLHSCWIRTPKPPLQIVVIPLVRVILPVRSRVPYVCPEFDPVWSKYSCGATVVSE